MQTGLTLLGCTCPGECRHWPSCSCLQCGRKYLRYHLSSHDKQKEPECYRPSYYFGQICVLQQHNVSFPSVAILELQIKTEVSRSNIFLQAMIMPEKQNDIVRPCDYVIHFGIKRCRLKASGPQMSHMTIWVRCSFFRRQQKRCHCKANFAYHYSTKDWKIDARGVWSFRRACEGIRWRGGLWRIWLNHTTSTSHPSLLVHHIYFCLECMHEQYFSHVKMLRCARMLMRTFFLTCTYHHACIYYHIHLLHVYKVTCYIDPVSNALYVYFDGSL